MKIRSHNHFFILFPTNTAPSSGIFHHPSPSWLFLSALAPRLAPSIRALSLPSSGMVCPNRYTTRGNGPACATVLLLPRLAQQGTPCLSCSCRPRFHMRIGGSERAWGAAPRPSQSSPGRNMKASQASVVVLWPRNQPSSARNAVLAPTPRKFSFVGAILGGCAPSSARPRRARRPRGACEANHREQRVPSGGVVIGGQCRATWWGNSAARARRCPKKSAAWRRTFAVLATFSGNMLSSGSGMRKRRAAHATALRVSAADAERARAYSATRSSSVSPPAPCFRGGGSVHFGRGSRKSVRPPNAVPLYDSSDIKRLSVEAWGVKKLS